MIFDNKILDSVSNIASSPEQNEWHLPAYQSVQVDKYLFEARIVLITGEITQKLGYSVVRLLLALAHASSDPVNILVCSPGGHVETGDMVHDTIKFIAPTVRMIGMGWVASAGALIYVSVPLERRFCLPNTRFLLHQPSGSAGGPVTDIEIQVCEILKMKDRLNKIFAAATNQPLEKIANDTDRDLWMNPQEAIDYGLVSRTITNINELRSQ